MSSPVSAPIGTTVLLSITMFCSSCLPAVNHGPQVEPGWNGGLSWSLHLGPRYGTGDLGAVPFLFGPVGLNVAHGWRSIEHNAGAVQLGVHVPLSLALNPPGLFYLAQADLYYQLPSSRTGTFDAGLGLNIASAHAMPYLQVGRIGANQSGWYTTQGIASIWRDGEFNTSLSAIAWLPTVAYQVGGPRVNYHWFLSGAVGKEFQECYTRGRCPPDEARCLLTAGVTIQFHRRR